MEYVKSKLFVNLLLFIIFITSITLAWSPQDDIDLKYRFNIVNDTAGSCDTGYVVQGRLQNGSWNCALATSFDSNETDRVDDLVTANVSTNTRVDDLNSSKIETSEEGNLNVNGSTYWGLANTYNSSTFQIISGSFEFVWTYFSDLYYTKDEVYNTTEIESMNTSIRSELSDTNETDRVDALELANVSTNDRIDDLNLTKIETSEEGNLNVNGSDYWDDLNTYNTTSLTTDDDNDLTVSQSWLESLFYTITQIEIFNTSLYSIFLNNEGIEMYGDIDMNNNYINNSLINVNSPISDNKMIGYFPFTFNTKEFTGRGNDGLLKNGLTLDNDSGKIGAGLSFDGVDDYLDITGQSCGLNEGTICSWIKPTSFSTAGYVFGHQITNDRLYLKLSINTGNVLLGLGNTGNEDMSYSPELNTWSHLCVSYNTTNYTFYVNGKEYKNGSQAGTISCTGDFLLGKHPLDASYFNGSIDEFTIFDSKLSDDEVVSLYSLNNQFYPQNTLNTEIWEQLFSDKYLIGYYPFIENATDYSGIGVNGVEYGNIEYLETGGRSDGYYTFDGVNDYLDISGQDCGTTSGTMCMWYKYEPRSVPQFVYGNSGTSRYYLSVDTADTFEIGLGDLALSNLNIVAKEDEWAFYCLTHNGTNYNFYENGILKRTNTYTGTVSCGSDFYIGKHPTANGNMNGSIDDFYLFSKDLSIYEIQSLYSLNSQMYPRKLFYKRSEIEEMNTTLTNEDTRINNELINLESNFTNENTSVWNNITNAEFNIVSNLAYLDNLQNNFTAQNVTNYDEMLLRNGSNTLTGNWNTGAYNITVSDGGYLMGQPLDGSLGSGIIWINGTTQFSELNVTCTGLSCSYVAFKVRLVTTSNVVTYCDIPAGSFNAVNNQHTVAYVDTNCDIQTTSIQTYITTPTSPGGIADFANVIAYGDNAENANGLGLESKRQIKLRKLLLLSTGQHLSVVNGFNYQTNGFSEFNITSGQYVYLYDVVPGTLQDTSVDGIEVVSHSGVGTWEHNEQTSLNLTSCDTGTGTVTCSTPSKYRRHFIFIVGSNDTGTDSTEIHQLLPLESVTYVSSSACLNTEKNPLSYTLPEYYEYGAVMLYAYCGRGSDSSWVNSQFIDLRTTKTGATSSITEGIYVKADGSTALTSNWNVGLFNITADTFYGRKVNTTTGTFTSITQNGQSVLDQSGFDYHNLSGLPTCSGTDKLTYDGTDLSCATDETAAGGEPKSGEDYLYNDSASIYWNDTRGNNTYVTYENLTILDKDTDTNCSGGDCTDVLYTANESILDVNTSLVSYDLENYNTTTLAKDNDGYLTVLLSWLTGLFYEKSEVYTKTEVEGLNTTLRTNISSINTDVNLLNGRANDLNFTTLAGLNTRLSDAVLVDTGTMTNTNWCKYNSASTDITCDVTPVVDTDTNETTRFNTLVGTDCGGTNKAVGVDADGTLSCSADIDTNTNCSTSGGCSTLYVGTNAVIHAASSWSGGDLGGTGLAPSVTDDSHNHVGTNIDAGAFNTGSYSFPDDVTIETIKMENDATNHQITDNSTCIIIKGDTSTLSIC